MNSEAYSLSDSYVSVGGKGFIPDYVDDNLREWLGKHYLVGAGIILALVIVIIWLLVWRCSEHFMPTATMRMQKLDGLGFEHMDSPAQANRSQSVFAQTVQSGGVATGSSAAQVLASADFDCANSKPIGDDAWAWMQGVASEGMVGKPSNDNDFSRILSGQ